MGASDYAVHISTNREDDPFVVYLKGLLPPLQLIERDTINHSFCAGAIPAIRGFRSSIRLLSNEPRTTQYGVTECSVVRHRYPPPGAQMHRDFGPGSVLQSISAAINIKCSLVSTAKMAIMFFVP